jgi:hypothetical protein
MDFLVSKNIILTMEDKHPTSNLTSEQRYRNYKLLLDTHEFFLNGGRITEDWLEEHKLYILRYRSWYSDYTTMNDEVEDENFRRICRDVETILSHLVMQIDKTNTYDPKVYKILNEYLKNMCECLFSEEELNDLMNNMRL